MPADLPDDLKNVTRRPSKRVQLAARRTTLTRPEGYEPDDGLVDAIKVALLLRKPLLVTGKPGTGKTDLGHYLAWKMRLQSYQFDAKSNSAARDLFYTYDAIGHYRAGQGTEVRPYLTFNAMGLAILRAAEQTPELQRLLPEFAGPEPSQSVVVIDEIDKAPRDFPNDLLNEIDKMYFYIPEMQNIRIAADREKRVEPILVITSNSEKNLPPPFLRRCVYYDIPFPSDAALKRIVAARLSEFASEEFASAAPTTTTPESAATPSTTTATGTAAPTTTAAGTAATSSPLLAEALSLFRVLWDENTGLSRQPGTAELLDWMLALIKLDASLDKGLRDQANLIRPTFSTLIKSEGDREAAEQAVENWMAAQA